MTNQESALLRALALMCEQYIGDGQALGHQCISAGEDAIELLVRYGMVEPSGRGGSWTEAGKDLLR
jgi:hypothetical protein